MGYNWNPYSSKWKAAEILGINLDINKEDNILYLGASSGNTINHISKLTEGLIFAIEISYKMAIGLIKLAELRNNIVPIIEDARNINKIKKRFQNKKIDILFQDIPTKDQIKILIDSSKIVNNNCKILFVLKTQSISNKTPELIFEEIKKELKRDFNILQSISLEPFQKKTLFF